MSYQIKPRPGYLLIGDFTPEEKTAGGIILTSNVKKADRLSQIGIIKDVCDPGSEFVIGEIVAFKQYAGEQINLGPESFVLIPETDVIGKIIEE
jgi:chaperonin GroES